MTIDERGLGRVQVFRRHTATFAILLAVLAMMVVAPYGSEDSTYHVVVELAGAIAMLAAITLRLWCTLYIGGRKDGELVTEGPYSVCRNPLYVGSILGAVGVGLQTGMVSFALVAGLVVWAIFEVVVRREEAFLKGRFGPAYDRYCARTPRFLPRFDRYEDGAGGGTFTTRSLQRTMRDGLVFLVAIPLTEVIEVLHESGRLPALLTLF